MSLCNEVLCDLVKVLALLMTRNSHLDAQLDYSASMLAILKWFGYDMNWFNGANVHFLTNVISTEFNVHDAFDQLMLNFEATASFNIATNFLSHDTHQVPFHSLRRIVMKSSGLAGTRTCVPIC